MHSSIILTVKNILQPELINFYVTLHFETLIYLHSEKEKRFTIYQFIVVVLLKTRLRWMIKHKVPASDFP